MSRFNLVDENWIPVRFPDGTRKELGIRAVLLQAKRITSIEDASPLVVAALHRFLLAVLYRALEGPTDIKQAKAIFISGFPKEKIDTYLEKWHDRFWLFDEKHPFGQIPNFQPKAFRAWTTLAAEHNADNAKVLFDHTNIEEPGSISPGETVRLMLASQTFSVSCGKSELAHTATAPSATTPIVLPLGHNLQDTLLCSLVPQHKEITMNDLPIWEREPESIAKLKKNMKRQVDGFADLYTWRIRSIRLEAADNANIEKIAFASGIGCSFRNAVRSDGCISN